MRRLLSLTVSLALRQSRLHLPWASVSSGLAVLLASLGFNLSGDVLRELPDPSLRGTV